MAHPEVSCTFEEFQKLTEQGNVIPVYKWITADLLTPAAAFLKMESQSSYGFLLESVEGGETIARYSFLGVGPFRTIRYLEGEATLVSSGSSSGVRKDFFALLREEVQQFRPVHINGIPPFTSGAVGYLGYDIVRLIERLPDRTRRDVDWDDALLMFFSNLVIFDHVRHQALIVSNVLVDEHSDRLTLQEKYRKAVQKVGSMERLLSAPLPARSVGRHRSASGHRAVNSTFTPQEFGGIVEKAKEYIGAGDIFQVVLSQRFDRRCEADPFDVYRALRIVNPSPYMYYLKLGDFQIIGSSPEMLVKVQGNKISYRPIAGTRPRSRGADDATDEQMAVELRNDEKEKAEHIMLVDLGRNDVGRVARYGTVKVPRQMFVEKYSHVMHLVSSVEGEMRRGFDAVDVLRACFPAGTVSGAPKVRAMEIIDELERTRRGIYAGGILYLDFSGNLDSCIAIRTIVMKDRHAYVQTGAGIVADSKPEREQQECVDKARSSWKAIELAEEGI
ncbi:MAG: anthranilate synthase component I [Acidobacteriia bacterium]|nr:anthranilate synthase component I [Terriglobia bacterium]